MISDPERAKLDAFSEQIRQAGAKVPAADETTPDQPVKATRIGFDFMGSVLGGAILGWLIDKGVPVLAPWALISMIVLGFGVGIWNVWRALSGPLPK